MIATDEAGGVFRLIQKGVSADHLLVQTYNAAGKFSGGELSHPCRKAKILSAGLSLQNAEMVGIQQSATN